MELLEGLKSRRSCRKYEDKQITESQLETILEAGLYAPSAKNQQAVVIVAAQSEEGVGALRKINMGVKGSDKDTFYGAPTVLLVIAPTSNAHAMVDGACVMENLMLAAHAEGLGACWINGAKEGMETAEGKALLQSWGLEGEYVGVGHCIVGYPAMDAPNPTARKENRTYKV